MAPANWFFSQREKERPYFPEGYNLEASQSSSIDPASSQKGGKLTENIYINVF